jgi:putative heme transporter
VGKIVVRVLLVVAALAVSFFVLARAFDDLDPAAVREALRSLGEAELLALAFGWLIWVATQGLQAAALTPGLPVRRGIVLFLGPSAVSSVVPGPSDLPLRFAMLTSWGSTRGDATLAVAANGIFSVGIKLLLPVVAAVGLLASDAPLEGTLRTVVTIAVLVGLGLAVIAVLLRRESWTAKAGRAIAPLWSATMRLLRKPEPPDLAEKLVAARAQALSTLRGRWPMTAWGTVLASATRFALLLMCLRFVGVTEEVLPWPQVFVVYALVQGLTVVPITAGGAGISEVAYIGMLTAAAVGNPVNEVTAGVLLFRLLTWIAVIPAGLAAIGVWRRALRRRVPAPVAT